MGVRAVKASVAAAVVGVAVLSGCAASQSPAVSMAAGVSAPGSGAMPGYYVVVAGREVVVRASGDGHVTGSAAIPVAAGSVESPVGGEPFGSSDGRHYVIVVSRGGDLPGVADVSLFLLTVSADGRPGKPSRVAFDSRGMPVIGAALSPDGTMLALSVVHEFAPPGALYGSVTVITLASGETRTWSGQRAAGYWPGVPAWVGDGVVAVPWWHDTGHLMAPAEITGVRQIDLAAAGRSLAAVRLAAFATPLAGLQSAVLAPGGGPVITSSCRAGHHVATVRVAERSAADGRLIRVLRAQTARFGNDADAQDAVSAMCQVLSVAGAGNHLLVQAFGFGRIDNGVFTSLPGSTPHVLPVAAGW